jgi:hypothetical protein
MYALSYFKGDLSDVRAVSRHLTFASTVQQANPRGILWGNWGSDFSGGKKPWQWQGSDEIFKQYVATGFSPVKYGQCWVFGGILNSLLRVLGIPSRHLTTFESAHESPVNGKYIHEISMIYNEFGNLKKRIGSVWNFHSWNDAWFNRPDLAGRNGWQAVDATPQEKSEGVFQMGPASLSAIYNFDDAAPYDTPFVISEVSAKYHNYMEKCDGCPRIDLGIDSDSHIGTLIMSNPVPGKNDTGDITGEYRKMAEVHMLRTPKKHRKMKRVASGEQDVAMFIEATNEQGFGQPIRVGAMFFGAGDQDLEIEAVVHGYYIDYTGGFLQNFRNYSVTANLTWANNYTDSWSVQVEDFLYETPIPQDFFFTLFAIVNGEDTMADQATLSLSLPPLTIQAPSAIPVGHQSPFSVLFTNPLPVPMTNITVKVRAVTMGVNLEVPMPDLPVGKPMILENLLLSPRTLGNEIIMASLFCDQLRVLDGSSTVHIFN